MFNSYAIDNILKYLFRIMYSLTSTPSWISLTSLSWTSLNASWNPSSMSWILIRSPHLWWKPHAAKLPPSYIKTYNNLLNNFIIWITKLTISTRGTMWHFYPVFPLKIPFRVTIKWYFSLLGLLSSYNFNIPSTEMIKTSSSLRPPPNPTNSTASKNNTSLLCMIFPYYLFQSAYHPTNSDFTSLLVTKNSYFFMTPICNFNPLKNWPNHGIFVWHFVFINLLLYHA